MTACPCHLADDPAGLCCTRTDEHPEHRGCCYTSTSGVAGAKKEEG